jgi:hypothetical protein
MDPVFDSKTQLWTIQRPGEDPETLPRICQKCRRDTQFPLFDGCMPGGPHCPYGFEPCL